MDLEFIVKIIGVMLLFIIPFMIMGINNKKKEGKMLQRLKLFAEKTNGTITRYDLSSSSLLIGIDDNTNQIYFIRQEGTIEICKRIDLSDIQESLVLNNTREVINKEGKYKMSDQIDLLLIHKGKPKKEEVLEFYNAKSGSSMLKGELQLADKWSRIINDSIAFRPKQLI